MPWDLFPRQTPEMAYQVIQSIDNELSNFTDEDSQDGEVRSYADALWTFRQKQVAICESGGIEPPGP